MSFVGSVTPLGVAKRKVGSMKYRIMILMMMMKFRGLILCDTVLTADVGERPGSGAT